LADAALHRLPRDWIDKLALAAELAQAGLAGENPLPPRPSILPPSNKAVTKRLARARSLSHQRALECRRHHHRASRSTDGKTALSAGAAMVELTTLRKLASLYFGGGKWRDG
jgi:hypothetical protein